jgi:outer membrane lipoprotein
MCADCSTAIAGFPDGRYRELMRRLWPILLAVLVGGCATAFPEAVMRTVDTRITVDDLLRDPAAHKGARVIVGGEILATQPRSGLTEIEILARRLRGDDSPERSDRSPGRLLLRTAEFLDPAVYAAGRRITAIGEVAGADERKIGEVPYRYPVITVERIRLWPQDVVIGRSYYPYPWGFGPYGYGPFYDPFYDPFYYGGPRRYRPGWWW